MQKENGEINHILISNKIGNANNNFPCIFIQLVTLTVKTLGMNNLNKQLREKKYNRFKMCSSIVFIVTFLGRS